MCLKKGKCCRRRKAQKEIVADEREEGRESVCFEMNDWGESGKVRKRTPR